MSSERNPFYHHNDEPPPSFQKQFGAAVPSSGDQSFPDQFTVEPSSSLLASSLQPKSTSNFESLTQISKEEIKFDENQDDNDDEESHAATTEPMCRICFETQSLDRNINTDTIDNDELIAPCLCSSSEMKWVHRSCLDEYRAINEHSEAFTQCTTCTFQYCWEDRDELLAKQSRQCCGFCLKPKWELRRRILWDVLMVLLVWLSVIFLSSLIPFFAFHQRPFMKCVLIGFVAICIVMGILALIHGLYNICRHMCSDDLDSSSNDVDSQRNYDNTNRRRHRRHYSYRRSSYGGTNNCCCVFHIPCPCGGIGRRHRRNRDRCCNCNGSDSENCGNGGGEGTLPCLIAIAVVLAVVGLIYAICLSVFIISRYAADHYDVYERRLMTRVFVVKDLSHMSLNEKRNIFEMQLPINDSGDSNNESDGIIRESGKEFNRLK